MLLVDHPLNWVNHHPHVEAEKTIVANPTLPINIKKTPLRMVKDHERSTLW